MDQISICDLELFARIGVSEAERAQPQRLLITVELDKDLRPAAQSGHLADTIDYAAVTEQVVQLAQSRSWILVETLAAEIADLILGRFQAAKVRVLVKKFILPQTRHVAVAIERFGHLE